VAALRDGVVFLFVCFFSFVCLSSETRTCRALAWLDQQCWRPWALLDQSGQFQTYDGSGGLSCRPFGSHRLAWTISDLNIMNVQLCPFSVYSQCLPDTLLKERLQQIYRRWSVAAPAMGLRGSSPPPPSGFCVKWCFVSITKLSQCYTWTNTVTLALTQYTVCILVSMIRSKSVLQTSAKFSLSYIPTGWLAFRRF